MLIFCIFIGMGTIGNVQNNVFQQVLSPSVRTFFPILISVLICLFLVLLFRAFDRFGRGQLIAASIVMLGIMTAIFLIIFCSFKIIPFTDALHVQEAALSFVNGGELPMTAATPRGSYFLKYPNNYFLVVILKCYFQLCLALGIQDTYWPLIVLSFAALMAAVVFMYLTGVLLGGLRKGAKLLALCVMNPLYYLLVFWVYTNELSIPFMMAGIYFSLRIYKAKGVWSRRIFCVLTAIVAIFGYYIRPTAVIPIIAAAGCAFLWSLRGKKNAGIVFRCAVLCAIIAVILFKAIGMVNDAHFSMDENGQFPVTHWIMMGSHGSGRHNKGDVQYTMQFDTLEERSKAALAKAIENYKNQTGTGLLSFMYDKMLVMWSYGDGGDLLNKVQQDINMTELYSYVLGDQADLFKTYAYAYRIVTVFLIIIAIWNLLGKKRIDPPQFLFILSFFGGILFYSFWEIKSTYGLPFIYNMLLIGEYGGEVLVQRIPEKRENRRSGRSSQIAAVGLVCALSICVLAYNDIINSKKVLREWSYNNQVETSMSDICPNEEEVELTQEVYISKPFNHIRIAGNANRQAVDDGASAQLTILNGDGNVVFERTITAQELFRKGYPIIDTGKIIPNGREKFTICLRKSSSGDERLYFRCRNNQYIDIYEGVLKVNGEQYRNDLFLQVYNEYEGPWCSVRTARLLMGALVLAILLLYLWMYLDLFIPRRSPSAMSQE